VFPVSRCLSAAGISFLDHPVPAEASAHLTVHLPDNDDVADIVRTTTGVSTFRAYEKRLGWVPPQPRGRRCPRDRHSLSGRRLPLFCGQPLPPNSHTISEGQVTRHHQRFTHVHPASLPLTRSSRTAQEPLGLNLKLRTQPLPATHVEAGTGHRTQARNYTIGTTSRSITRCIHSCRATSCRTGIT
jgi:hypothetical protein